MVKRTLSSGGFEAEFYSDKWGEQSVVHYVISRKGDSEILAWGQEASMEEAKRAALEAMHDLYKHHAAAG